MGKSIINSIEQWLADMTQRVAIDGEVSSYRSPLIYFIFKIHQWFKRTDSKQNIEICLRHQLQYKTNKLVKLFEEISGVMCDRKMPVELKDKVFKTIIITAMTYGSECWAVKKKDENKLNSAEMRMVRWARGKTWLNHIRNEDIRKKAHIKSVETFLENNRLKWFGHCLRREHNHICAKSLLLEVSGRRSRGRPKKRWRDNIKEDMKKYRLTKDMAQYRRFWMTEILAGPAQGEGQERWERQSCWRFFIRFCEI